ncbi:hypothetical protein NV64_07515 [Erwinia sp. B116]|nr:hypothetical protein NV64_07515 [Erwinia sp. B116]
MTVEAVTKQIQQQGAKQFISEMPDAPGGKWHSIMQHIASGNASWLSLVPLLAPEVDAGFADDLATSLAEAIPANVEGVMSAIDDYHHPVSTQSVCAMPLYTRSVAEQNDYVVKAIQALYKSKSAQAMKCLNQLVSMVGQSSTFREAN